MDKKIKRCRKLTPEERKAVYAAPISNAGAGWISTGNDPLTAEYGPHREVMDPRDGEFYDE